MVYFLDSFLPNWTGDKLDFEKSAPFINTTQKLKLIKSYQYTYLY